MQQSVKEVVQGVILESRNVEQAVLATRQNITELTHQIQEVYATTEELSAGMEETAASSEEMSATATEIERAVSSIAIKAQQGAVQKGPSLPTHSNTLQHAKRFLFPKRNGTFWLLNLKCYICKQVEGIWQKIKN